MNAAFSVDNEAVQYPDTTVQFTDQSTGDITKWEWDFNSDGFIDETIFPPDNPDTQYSYNSNGYYRATLTVTGPYPDCVDEAYIWIQVTGCPG